MFLFALTYIASGYSWACGMSMYELHRVSYGYIHTHIYAHIENI